MARIQFDAVRAFPSPFLALAGSLTLVSCNTLSAGREYTMAKVDRDLTLVEPNRLLDAGPDDDLDKQNPTGFWGLYLKGGYLPYLESVERPEVVMFVAIRIRGRTDAEETLLWEKVILNSELEEHNMVLNKDSFIPRKDVVRLGGFLRHYSRAAA